MIGQVYEWDIREGEGDSWYLPFTTYAENKNLIPETELHTENNSELIRGAVAEMIYRLLVITELELDLFTTEAELEIQNRIAELKTVISSDNIEIILTWNNLAIDLETELETDLDLYLTTPENEEISYRRKLSTDYEILFDSAVNEEIITIEKLYEGNYELFITSDTSFEEVAATVKIYEDGTLTHSFESEASEEKVWKLLNILNSSEILTLNQYGDCILIQKENSYCH